ncbi:MAG: hypothetical protein F6K36_28395 [Symploca sp. SIO3C6]|nr:hypothetical protein [Symploca sp. SIO3C6]
MDLERIKETLQEFVDRKNGIQGFALVGKGGVLITKPPIGNWNQNTVGLIAGIMAQLTTHIGERLKWDSAQDIYVESKDGYIMRVACSSHMFLLVKASNMTNQGLLEVAIAPIVEEIQAEINARSSINKEARNNNGGNDSQQPQGRY